MTLRETIASIVDNADSADPLWMFDAADDIIAAIRTHMTSPEAVERACEAFDPPIGEITLGKVLKPCLEAALGEEL